MGTANSTGSFERLRRFGSAHHPRYLRFAADSSEGLRKYNEDRCLARSAVGLSGPVVPPVENPETSATGTVKSLAPAALLCVFDGHNGDQTASTLLEAMPAAVEKAVMHLREEEEEKLLQEKEPRGCFGFLRGSAPERTSKDYVGSSHGSKSKELHPRESVESHPLEPSAVKEEHESPPVEGRETKSEPLTEDLMHKLEILRNAFAECDSKVIEKNKATDNESGSTAVVVYVDTNYILSANVGDSRAVVYRGNRSVFQISRDHKPFHEDEKARIEAAGGAVITGYIMTSSGAALAVSRAFGDGFFKTPPNNFVTCEPFLNALQREDDDQFVVMGSDGLYDVFSNLEVCEFIRKKLEKGFRIEKITKMLIQEAIRRGSKDNVSAVICLLRNLEREEAEDAEPEELKDTGKMEVSRLDDATLAMKLAVGSADGDIEASAISLSGDLSVNEK